MKRNILATVMGLLMLTMLATSVFAFWTPPPGPTPPPAPKPIFGVSIEGLLTGPGETFDFKEPEWGKGDCFTVQVSIFNVTDLYGYEFKMSWHGDYFELIDYEYETFANEIWPLGWYAIAPDETAYTGPPYARGYHQAISAMAPSEGFDGSHVVAEFKFRFVKDICWPQGSDYGWIWTYDQIMADSTGNRIQMGTHLNVQWKFIAVQPKIYLCPDKEENEAYIVEDGTKSLTFNMSVMVANITKMKSLNFTLMWMQRFVTRFENDTYWTSILKATGFEVNNAVFFEPNFTSAVSMGSTLLEGVKVDYIEFTAEMNETYTSPDITPLIRGDFEVLKITFTKLDPWPGKRQPDYTYNAVSKEWELEIADTPIWFQEGNFTVLCPTLERIHFGKATLSLYAAEYSALYEGAKYTLTPKPGDLDGDSDIDLVDLMVIASYYGADCYYGASYPEIIPAYYDLNKDNVINIIDVVIVAKYYAP